MTNAFVSLLSNAQVDLPELRLALSEALENSVERTEVSRLILSHALASLGRALCLAGSAEVGIEFLADAMDTHPSAGSHSFLHLLIRQAEDAGAQGESQEAIHRWQDIAVLMGEKTPEFVYRELSHAYAQTRQGFGGNPVENHCWGDCHKHDVLAFLHEVLKPELYLEIGVDEGLSLARARGLAIGIDPRPELKLNSLLPASTEILPLSSDAFFKEEADRLLQPPPELIFIDGMHLFEFVLRDFIAAEKYASPHSLVVIDDIYPCHPVQAARRRQSTSWTGDVWKFHQILQRERPDLTLLGLNSYSTGLLLIAGLNPLDTRLQTVYSEVVREFRPIHEVPDDLIARRGAIPSSHPILADLVRCLNKAKRKHWSVKKVQAALDKVRQNAEHVSTEFQVQPSTSFDSSDLASLATKLLGDETSEDSLSDDLDSAH
jgi:hypothetical protein